MLTIKSDNPKYNKEWKFHLLFDGGIPQCHRGHSKYGINFLVEYEDTIWGQEDEVSAYVKDNLIMPFLEKNQLIETDAEGLLRPTKKLMGD